MKEKKLYRSTFFDYSESISFKKRKEMLKIINSFIKYKEIKSVLDVGTIDNKEEKTANYIAKNLKNIKKINSLSIQNITEKKFQKNFKKSITSTFSKDDLKVMKSDLVLSTATIEHVGIFKNQIKMIENIIKLSKKIFIITTPNRQHPIEFHTKLPLIHLLNKQIHRKILSFLGFSFFSKEKNLNLLTKNDFKNIMKKLNFDDYNIVDIKLFHFNSNIILFGYIRN